MGTRAVSLRNIPQGVDREALLRLMDETLKGWRSSVGYRVEWVSATRTLRFTLLRRPRAEVVGVITDDFWVITHVKSVSTDTTWELHRNPDGTFRLRAGSGREVCNFRPSSRVGIAGFTVRAWKLCAKAQE